jgi:hypothetical protein
MRPQRVFRGGPFRGEQPSADAVQGRGGPSPPSRIGDQRAVTGQDDDLVKFAGGVPAPPVSEAQLTAALVMQAQALDAMRRAHSDLLLRLEQGPEREALASALEDLRAATERVREGQERAARRMSRSRRRFALAGALAVLVAVGSALAVSWSAQRMLAGSAERDQDRRQQSEALAGLASRLDAQEAELRRRADEADAAREAAEQALADVRDGANAVNAELAETRRDRDAQKARADREREQHLSALGDSARLRDQLQERDERLTDLGHTLADLQQGRSIPPATGIVASSANAAGLAARLTLALRNSGARGVAVVEAGGVQDGAITGLLVVHEATDDAPSSALRAERGEIAVQDGRAVLLLSSAGQTPQSVPLPDLDRSAWRQAGLNLPATAVSAAHLATALGALLEPQGWSVAELAGWDGESLRGLRLEQREPSGKLARVLRAERGTVLTGPELELKDGSLRVGDDERGFYSGVYRLPLAGADLNPWLATLQAESR